ncbi:MAG: DUF433 domain-containing protein [Gemmataceae bacterium]|nr:DUF433 domain-containing protein [Gemmataceae bacterium]
MQLEDYFDFHTTPVEYVRIKGTRIDIDFVIELYKRHMTPEQIAVHFGCPLDPVQVYATITYYLHNKAEIDAYLARREQKWQATYAAYLAQEPPEVVKRIRAIKAARAGNPAEAS